VGTYNFENVDYDYPPPGSPPRPSQVALPNDYGNSNGLIPTFDLDQAQAPRQMWFKRIANAVLPSHFTQRLGFAPQRTVGPIGGGTNNDGVFANVSAKPAAPVRVQDGDDTYIVPEDARTDAPPSYASAQADAVPPYWETTVHAPFSPDSIGEMIVDSMPTGSIFSFVWNLLVSVSFQFVGFLLSYLLSTTHAARLGSRAGLGFTLIQYGFALRGRLEEESSNESSWRDWTSDSPHPTFGSASEADAWSQSQNMTMPNMSDEQTTMLVADATTEWLSFFLMTVGWFILLTSVLAFWRVKRWERGILASQRETNNASNRPNLDIVSHLERTLGIRAFANRDLFRRGFGWGRPVPDEEEVATLAAARAEEGEAHDVEETDPVIASDPNNPERSRRLVEETRLRRDLRDAGLI